MIQSLNKIIHNPLSLKKKEFINNKLKDKPIILVGMPGSGKTVIGKIMAKKLNRIFYDSDQIIEGRFGYTISEIFEKMGEKKFREIEYEELLKIKNGNFVIATGGGAYIYPKSHYLINKYGFTIWIKASQKIIVQRTINNKNRPLLQGSGIITKVKVLLRERNPIYSKAKLTVFATKENKIKMLNNVIYAISKNLNDNKND